MLEGLRLRLASAFLPKQFGNISDVASAITMLHQRGAPKRGTTELIAMYRTSPWFRAVVSKVANSVAAVPWKLFGVRAPVNGRGARDVGDYVKHHVRFAGAGIRQRMLTELKQAGRLVPIEDHPLIDLLANANPSMTGLNGTRLTETYIDINGEAFWVIERDALGTPVEYWPIPPDWIQRIPEDGNDFFWVQPRTGRTASAQLVPPDDMIWFRDLNPSDPYGRGVGVGESLGDEIDTDEYAAKMTKSHFLNRAIPDLMISVKGASQPNLKKAKQEYDNAHRSYWKSHRTFWHSGDVEVKELQQKFVDMQLGELRKFERDTVISVYGVPPEILGVVENSNRATALAAQTIFAKEVLTPRLEFLRAELQAKLVPLYDDRLVLAFESPIPADREFQLDALRAAPHMATRGEWRQFQGLADRGDEDNVHAMPLNLILEEAPKSPNQVAGRPIRHALPAHTKSISESDAAAIARAIKSGPLAEALATSLGEGVRRFSRRAAREVGLDPSRLDLDSPAIQRHLDDVAKVRAAAITTTTARITENAMRKGAAAGETGAALQARLGGAVMSAGRIRGIAQTEANRTANFARVETFRQGGVEQKQWVTVGDDVVRELHEQLEGATVRIDQPFEIEGFSAMHPGDFGDPSMDANCRCTVFPVTVTIEASPQLGTVARQFVQDLLEFEREVEDDVRRAFGEQLRQALEALALADI